MHRATATLLACLLVSCTVHQPPVPLAARAPQAVEEVLKIYAEQGRGGRAGHGWRSGIYLYTAAHTVGTATRIAWFWKGQRGTARLASVDEERDTAKLLLEDGERAPTKTDFALPNLPLADREPYPAERLWYVGFMDGMESFQAPSAVYQGRFVGVSPTRWVVDGLGVEGVSGSPLLTDQGEVIGILTSMGHLSTSWKSFRPDVGSGIPLILQQVFHLVHRRPVVFAQPVPD